MYHYDDTRQRFGKVTREASGKPRIRLAVCPPPCQWCPKISQGEEPKPSNAVELSPRNRQAIQHYWECRAVGLFPEDWLVRRHAAILRSIEDQIQLMRNRDLMREAAAEIKLFLVGARR